MIAMNLFAKSKPALTNLLGAYNDCKEMNEVSKNIAELQKNSAFVHLSFKFFLWYSNDSEVQEEVWMGMPPQW